MSDRAKELGKVDRVFFGFEDHGILTCWVHLSFGGTGQGFGGCALDESNEKGRRVGTAGGLDFILRLLELFKVDELGKIAGRTVYALRETDSYGAPIIGLEVPAFDGGGSFRLKDWQAQWFPETVR